MVAGLSISTGGVTVLYLSETSIRGYVLIQPMKTRPDMTEDF